jgi:hypothetical protein
MSMNLNSSGVHRLAPAIEEDESCANSRAGGSGESKLLGAEDVLQHHSRSSRQHHHDALVMHPSVVSNTAGAQQHQLQQQVPDNTGLLSNHPAAPAPQGDDGAAQAMSAGRGIEVQQPSLSLPEFSGSLPDQSAAQQQLSQDMEAQQQQQAPHEERYMCEWGSLMRYTQALVDMLACDWIMDWRCVLAALKTLLLLHNMNHY